MTGTKITNVTTNDTKDIRIVKGFGEVCTGQRNLVFFYYEWKESN